MPLMTEKSSPVLLCAATRWEAEPLVSRWNLRETAPGRWEGMVRDISVLLVKTGVGAGNVREALANLSAPRFVVSTGFAGALQDKMYCGDVVMDVRELDLEVPQAARAISAEKKIAVHFGRIAHSDSVVASPAAKKALGDSQRASAVDMESSAIKAWASSKGVPFVTARVVLDAVDERLMAEVPAGETMKELVPFALNHFTDIPLMIKLGLRQGRAMDKLAIFLSELLPIL
jgi:nucleoside phosphorylase